MLPHNLKNTAHTKLANICRKNKETKLDQINQTYIPCKNQGNKEISEVQQVAKKTIKANGPLYL